MGCSYDSLVDIPLITLGRLQARNILHRLIQGFSTRCHDQLVKCRVDIFRDDTALSTVRCDDGNWHRVTMTGDYGSATYTLSWQIDGVAMPSIRSVGQPPATVHRLWLGDATPGKTNTTDWAAVSLALR